jgi:dynein assembly factor 1, axonemal
MTEMTKPLLRKLCKDQGLYVTPNINDKLYLHYKGFNSIANLDEYVGLKALWLEGNGFSKIEGLEHQKMLKTLFLHENIIDKIEGLENQTELDNLNLSKNFIRVIENLSHMKHLTSLNLANNTISALSGVEHVLEIPSLQTLDLQHNKIEDAGIVDIVAQLPDLRVLYLMGNPAVKNIRNYRKTLVSRCKALKYLDDRPVFEEERRRTDAWAAVLSSGGTDAEAMEAERAELRLIRKEKDDNDEQNFRAFETLMREGAEIRRQRELAEREASGTVACASLSSGEDSGPERGADTDIEEINPFSGERILAVPESQELRAAREARWGPNSVPFDVRMQQQQQQQRSGEVSTAKEVEDELLAADAAAALPASNADLWKDVYARAAAGGAPAEATVNSKTVVPGEGGGEGEGSDESAAPVDEHKEAGAAPEAGEGEGEGAKKEKTSKFMSLLGEASREVAQQAVTANMAVWASVDVEELD